MATPNFGGGTTLPTGWNYVSSTRRFNSLAGAQTHDSVIRLSGATYDGRYILALTSAESGEANRIYIYYSTDGASWTVCSTYLSAPAAVDSFGGVCMWPNPNDGDEFFVGAQTTDTAGSDQTEVFKVSFTGTDVTVDAQLTGTGASNTSGNPAMFVTDHTTAGDAVIFLGCERAGATAWGAQVFLWDESLATLSSLGNSTIPGIGSASVSSNVSFAIDFTTDAYLANSFLDTTEATSDIMACHVDNAHFDVEVGAMYWSGTLYQAGTAYAPVAGTSGSEAMGLFSPTSSKYYILSNIDSTFSFISKADFRSATSWTSISAWSSGPSSTNFLIRGGRWKSNNKIEFSIYDGTSTDMWLMTYDIAEDSWSSVQTYDKSSFGGGSNSLVGISVCRDEADNSVIYAYIVDDSSNYWAVTYVTNSPPSATITAPATGTNQDIEDQLLLDWTFNDPESDAQTHYSIRRIIDAVTTEYWNGTGWVGSESGSTEIASAASSITFDTHWGDPSSETVHSYSVKVKDDGSTTFGNWSSAVAVYPTTTISTNRGFSLPRPYKKQENLNAVLKSNTDYMLSWINSYVPAYGDLNDHLYLKAGVRAGGPSQLRDTFPPVVGEFDLGNGTNYFNAVGAVNVYRTNELTLSDKKAKKIKGDMVFDGILFIKNLPIKAFKYKDSKRNGKDQTRYGPTAQDVRKHLVRSGIDSEDQSVIVTDVDSDGNETLFVVENQLSYLHMQATKQLVARVEELQAQIDALKKIKNT